MADHQEGSKRPRREIVIVNKAEPAKPHSLDHLEKWAKIISIVAIPLLLAFFGNSVQVALQTKELDRDYVTLAVQVLQNKDSDEQLRRWAVELLDSHSETKFGPQLRQAILSGAVVLPLPTSESERSKVDLEHLVGIQAPDYGMLPQQLRKVLESSTLQVQNGLSGRRLYVELDDIRKASLLNLYAVMARKMVSEQRSTFDYVKRIAALRPDRFLAFVDGDLRNAVSASVIFRKTSGALHVPIPGYERLDSFKTVDLYGSLQITFFASATEPDKHLIDVDVDTSKGLDRISEIVKRNLKGSTVHPYEIFEILVHHHGLDPGYRWLIAPKQPQR